MAEKEFIQHIREFNRFYASILGVYNQYALNTKYSLAEARILGEVQRNPGCTASWISRYMDMDKSYAARILRRFEKNGLLVREEVLSDSRKRCLRLTDEGRRVYLEFEKLSDERIQLQLSLIPEEDWHKLENAMKDIQAIWKEDLSYGKNRNSSGV